MLHTPLQYTRPRLNTTLEAVAVAFRPDGQHTVCSRYLSPNTNIDKEEVRDLIYQPLRSYLLMGDFNAKHLAWDLENPADARARMIRSLMVKESLGFLNLGSPTHHHALTSSISAVDFCFSSVVTQRDFQLETNEDLHGSDHLPMYLTKVEYLPQHHVPRWLMNRANSEQFLEVTQIVMEIPGCCPLEDLQKKSDTTLRTKTKHPSTILVCTSR